MNNRMAEELRSRSVAKTSTNHRCDKFSTKFGLIRTTFMFPTANFISSLLQEISMNGDDGPDGRHMEIGDEGPDGK